ncbi:DNA methylase, partial [Haemophilus influenzae]
MKNRLEIAKTLLADDGVIFVQCDDNEQAYLKILMDEVFGRENFVTTIHCQMSTTQGMKVKAAQDGNIVKNAEYIIVFSKNGHKNIAINPLYDLRSEYDEHYSLYLKNDGAIGQLKELYDYRFPK